MCSRYCVCESKTSPGNKIVMAASYETCLERSVRAKEQKQICSVNAEMETQESDFPKTIQGWPAGWWQKGDCLLCVYLSDCISVSALLLSASLIFGVKSKYLSWTCQKSNTCHSKMHVRQWFSDLCSLCWDLSELGSNLRHLVRRKAHLNKAVADLQYSEQFYILS